MTTDPQHFDIVQHHAHAELVETVDISDDVVEVETEDSDYDKNDGPRSSSINVFQFSLGSTTIILSELGASIMNWYIIHDDDDDDGDTKPNITDIVVGYKDVKAAYKTKNPVYFGTVCGRVANRIGGGQFTIPSICGDKNNNNNNTTDGKTQTYQLPINDTPRRNTLHGGPYGLSHKIWNGSVTKQGTAVQFVVKSHDKDQGFPGTLQVKATYSLRQSMSRKGGRGGGSGVVLTLKLEAELVEPSETIQTPVNLTNHTYFNLNGSDSAFCATVDDVSHDGNNTSKTTGSGVLDHKLMLECDEYTPVDTETLITTKQVLPASSGAAGCMDFRVPKLIRECIQSMGLEEENNGRNMDLEVNEDLNDRRRVCSSPYGLDHNFVVRKQDGLALPRVAQLVTCNKTSSGGDGRPRRRRQLTVYSNAPGVQVYTANYLDPAASVTNSFQCKTSYGPWSAICLETQHFPDSISFQQEDSTNSTFWTGRCPILSSDNPTYEQTVEYCLEEFVDEECNLDDDGDGRVVGCDTNDVTFSSIEEMWAAQDLSHWYGRAADWYEENCPTTIDGVLGGIGHVSDTDLSGSRRFLQSLFGEVNNDPSSNKSIRLACEIGAGIGRVTKGLLLDFADRCDLVESSPRLLASAPDHLGNRMAAKCRFFCNSLQDWKPPSTAKYSIIWIQWVLCYLTDKDAVSFLKRCADSLDDGGYIILKENVCEEQLFVVDADDASLTRSVGYWNDLIYKSGLRLCTITFQDDFPDEIYPVPMIALRPW